MTDVTNTTSIYLAPFEQLRMTDVEAVGGNNASSGESMSLDPDSVIDTWQKLATDTEGRA